MTSTLAKIQGGKGAGCGERRERVAILKEMIKCEFFKPSLTPLDFSS